MKKCTVWMVALLIGTAALAAAPSDADAAFRLGADLKWLPAATETITENGQELDTTRELDSLGVGARFMLGFDIFAIGAKLNFMAHSFENDDLNFSELDLNVIARLGIPATSLAVFAEVGPSLALDFDGIGYNAVVGLEYDIFGLPLIDLNVGLGGQYANVPVSGGGDLTRDHESFRAFLFIGVDFSL